MFKHTVYGKSIILLLTSSALLFTSYFMFDEYTYTQQLFLNSSSTNNTKPYQRDPNIGYSTLREDDEWEWVWVWEEVDVPSNGDTSKVGYFGAKYYWIQYETGGTNDKAFGAVTLNDGYNGQAYGIQFDLKQGSAMTFVSKIYTDDPVKWSMFKRPMEIYFGSDGNGRNSGGLWADSNYKTVDSDNNSLARAWLDAYGTYPEDFKEAQLSMFDEFYGNPVIEALKGWGFDFSNRADTCLGAIFSFAHQWGAGQHISTKQGNRNFLGAVHEFHGFSNITVTGADRMRAIAAEVNKLSNEEFLTWIYKTVRKSTHDARNPGKTFTPARYNEEYNTAIETLKEEMSGGSSTGTTKKRVKVLKRVRKNKTLQTLSAQQSNMTANLAYKVIQEMRNLIGEPYVYGGDPMKGLYSEYSKISTFSTNTNHGGLGLTKCKHMTAYSSYNRYCSNCSSGGGVDCSSSISWALYKAQVPEFKTFVRETTNTMVTDGQGSKSRYTYIGEYGSVDLYPADLLINKGATHVVMYAGNNSIIHASISAGVTEAGINNYITSKDWEVYRVNSLAQAAKALLNANQESQVAGTTSNMAVSVKPKPGTTTQYEGHTVLLSRPDSPVKYPIYDSPDREKYEQLAIDFLNKEASRFSSNGTFTYAHDSLGATTSECEKWTERVYRAAYGAYKSDDDSITKRYGCAHGSRYNNLVSMDINNIPNGAVVWANMEVIPGDEEGVVKQVRATVDNIFYYASTSFSTTSKSPCCYSPDFKPYTMGKYTGTWHNYGHVGIHYEGIIYNQIKGSVHPYTMSQWISTFGWGGWGVYFSTLNYAGYKIQ